MKFHRLCLHQGVQIVDGSAVLLCQSHSHGVVRLGVTVVPLQLTEQLLSHGSRGGEDDLRTGAIPLDKTKDSVQVSLVFYNADKNLTVFHTQVIP